jgi:hypothetical protein
MPDNSAGNQPAPAAQPQKQKAEIIDLPPQKEAPPGIDEASSGDVALWCN